jgi:hypothetical protein
LECYSEVILHTFPGHNDEFSPGYLYMTAVHTALVSKTLSRDMFTDRKSSKDICSPLPPDLTTPDYYLWWSIEGRSLQRHNEQHPSG